MKQAILVVCYGTNDRIGNKQAVVKLENKLQQKFAGCSFYCVYTHLGFKASQAGHVFHAVGTSSSKERIWRGSESFSRITQQMLADDVTDVWIQPTYVLDGRAYRDLKKNTACLKERFTHLWIGKPLLYDEDDYLQIAQAVINRFQCELDGHTAVLLAGHGTTYADYDIRLNRCFTQMGYDQFWVGMLSGRHMSGARQRLAQHLMDLQKKSYHKIILLPLMFAAGRHAQEDLAGEGPGSWKTICTDAGFCVASRLAGLGEIEEITDIYVQHVRAFA